MSELFAFDLGAEKPEPMEKAHNGQTNEVRRKQSASGLEVPAWQDGMKTHQEVTCYDPIANPEAEPMEDKQGVGGAGYDYSDYEKTTNSMPVRGMKEERSENGMMGE